MQFTIKWTQKNQKMILLAILEAPSNFNSKKEIGTKLITAGVQIFVRASRQKKSIPL